MTTKDNKEYKKICIRVTTCFDQKFDRAANMRFLHKQGYRNMAGNEALYLYIELLGMDHVLLKEVMERASKDYGHLSNHTKKMIAVIEDSLRFYMKYYPD